MFFTDLPCQNWYEAFFGPPWVEIILLAFKSQKSESSERRAVVLPVPLGPWATVTGQFKFVSRIVRYWNDIALAPSKNKELIALWIQIFPSGCSPSTKCISTYHQYNTTESAFQSKINFVLIWRFYIKLKPHSYQNLNMFKNVFD